MSIITSLNKAFENRVRLGIMTILMKNERVDFNRLKSVLEVTDGNLASHLSSLEEKEYLTISKRFIEKKPNTTYQITTEGRYEFKMHIRTLAILIKSIPSSTD